MRRLAVLGCAWSLTGCGGAVMRLPTLDYDHPTRLDVRSEGQPVQVDVVKLSDPQKPVVASCRALCRLELPSGRYLLRAHNASFERESAINLQDDTRVKVRPGDDTASNWGIGMTVVGGGALLGSVVIGATTAPLHSPGEKNVTTEVLPYVALGGAVVMVTGIVTLVSNRTKIEVTHVEAGSAYVDADGAGLRF